MKKSHLSSIPSLLLYYRVKKNFLTFSRSKGGKKCRNDTFDFRIIDIALKPPAVFQMLRHLFQVRILSESAMASS